MSGDSTGLAVGGGAAAVIKRAGRRLETQGTGPHRGKGMEPRGRFRNHPQCSLPKTKEKGGKGNIKAGTWPKPLLPPLAQSFS